jgi:hypothetical protein
LKSAASKPLMLPPPLSPKTIPATPTGSATGPTVLGQGQIQQPGKASIPYETNGPADTPPAASTHTSGTDIDWAQVYFGSYNLPPDLVAQIEALGQQYGTTNPDVFFAQAQNLIRQSDWFQQNYPGFSSGVTAGLFTDESAYRGYVNSLNQIYQQYLGRAVSGDEVSAALAQGLSPDLIARQFQGDVIAKVQAPQWNYLSGAFADKPVTGAERQAYGREQAGIDTPLGQMVQQRIQQATARAQALFSGTLSTPSLSLTQGRLSAPSLGPGAGNADVGA